MVRAVSTIDTRDAQAFVRELFNESYRKLVAQLVGVCGDLGDAEDAVQEAFVRAFARAESVQSMDNPEGWLYTVALNHLRTGWRRLKRHRAAVQRIGGGMRISDSMPQLSGEYVDLIEALKQIPDTQRETVILHYIGGLQITEIAEQLGIAEGSVKARLSRARTALAAILDPADDAATTEEPTGNGGNDHA